MENTPRKTVLCTFTKSFTYRNFDTDESNVSRSKTAMVFRLVYLMLAFCVALPVAEAVPLENPDFMQRPDPDGRYTLDEVRRLRDADWEKVNAANFGKTGGYGWVKFTYQTRKSQTLWIEVQSHFIDSLVLYVDDFQDKGSDATMMSGFGHQPMKHRYFLFPYHFTKGKRYQIFIRGFVRAPDVLKMPVVIWEPQAFLEHNFGDIWNWAFFVGIVMMSLILSLVSFGFGKTSSSYLYFAGYVCFINIYALLNDGWGVFLPSFLSYLDANTVLGHWINIGLGFFVLFSGKFLAIGQSDNRMLVRFNPLVITLCVEVAILMVHIAEWQRLDDLFLVSYYAGLILSFGYLVCWLLYVADAMRRRFKPVWVHISSVAVLVCFLCFNALLVNAGVIKEAIPDMLLFRYAITIDIVVILIGWVYRQRILESERMELAFENVLKQQAADDAVRLRQQEEIKVLSLRNEIEQQRVRLARDLHDGIGSELTHIINRLDILAYKSDIQQPLLSLGDFTRATNQNLRDTLWILNQQSIDAHQWYQRTLAWLGRIWEDRENPRLQTHCDCPEDLYLGPAVANAIFRITQEAVNNALKYASATEITFEMCFDDERLVFSVTDNGQGFVINDVAKGYGLTNMQCRAEDIGGMFELRSDRGGASVRVIIPLTAKYVS